MREPTEEQIKEFWEWCGWWTETGQLWHTPDDDRFFFNLPPIDLNNLFKWAVPKTLVTIIEQQECDFHTALSILYKKWEQLIDTVEFIPYALFWAIWEVIDKDML